jgi:hypothetical protein
MINIDKLASVIMRRCKCSREDALTALGEAWLTADHSLSEPEVAGYLLETGYFRYLDTVSSATRSVSDANRAKAFLEQFNKCDGDMRKEWDGTIAGVLELTLPQPEEVQSDMDYIVELVHEAPEEYKWPITVVCHDLLTSRIKNRQPLTVEMTRQLLKRRKIRNTTEIARQVYTFLITRRPHA